MIQEDQYMNYYFLFFSQDKAVDAVNDGLANAKAAAGSAADTIQENVEALKEKACMFI